MALSYQAIYGMTLEHEAYSTTIAGPTMDDPGDTPYGEAKVISEANGSGFSFSSTSILDGAANGDVVWRMGWFRGEALANGKSTGILYLSTDGAGDRALMALVLSRAIGGAYSLYVLDDASATLGSGAVTFSAETWHMVIWRFDGTDIKVWWDGSLIVNFGGSEYPDDYDFAVGGSNDPASPDRWWYAWAYVTSDDDEDIDETADYTECHPHIPDDDGNYGQFGDENDCTTADGTYDDWDDWLNGADADDNTHYCCGNNDDTYRESSTVTSATYYNTPECVQVNARHAATAAGKTLPAYLLLRESATDGESTSWNVAGSVYSPKGAIYAAPPGGGAWTQAKINASEIGVRRDVSSDAANWKVTAIAAEGLAIGTTEPPAAAARRIFIT